jgi:AraC family L-rhamnose operon regulatory protein RhaS
MLRDNTLLSVTEIALACGFNTSQYFATCFRKYSGCTPNDYRQRKPQVEGKSTKLHY